MMAKNAGELTGSGRKKYRVIQWATGNIGRRAMRTVIEHPQMELVGLYVSAPEKVGKDAGTLCGAAPVGIVATNSIDEIVGDGDIAPT